MPPDRLVRSHLPRVNHLQQVGALFLETLQGVGFAGPSPWFKRDIITLDLPGALPVSPVLSNNRFLKHPQRNGVVANEALDCGVMGRVATQTRQNAFYGKEG